MKFGQMGRPRAIQVRYERASNGLTPSEREVEVKFGKSIYRVLVPESTVDVSRKTISIFVVEHPGDDRYYLVDLGGEALNSTRRVKVKRGHVSEVR